MNKLLVITLVGVFGAVSGVFVGTQYIEAQKPATTFTGLVVASDSEPIVLSVDTSQRIVGTESLQGGSNTFDYVQGMDYNYIQ